MTETFSSDRILAELALLREQEKLVDVEEAQVKVVIFRIAGSPYALYGDTVLEILPSSEISPVPGTPPYLLGLVNIRGDVESVVDIRSFLGMESGRGGAGMIVLAESGGVRSGIAVDLVTDVADVPVSAVAPSLETLAPAVREIVAGSLEFQGESVTVLDIAVIFGKISC